MWRASEFPFGKASFRKVIRDAAGAFADGRGLAQEAEQLSGSRVEFLPSCRRLPDGSFPDVESVDVLFVGRLHVNKGPDNLLRALALLRSDGHDIKARICGSGPLEADLRLSIAELGLEATVVLDPPISALELANQLRQTRALVIPSRIDSIPLILGDAIQTRTPVVVSRVGDLGEIVERFDLGIACSTDDVESLADAIRLALAPSSLSFDWDAARQHLSPDRAPETFSSLLLAMKLLENQSGHEDDSG